MPSTQLIVRKHISAESTAVFAKISDLTTHYQWSSNDLAIQAVDDSEIYVGKRYLGHAVVRRLQFEAEFTVTEYEPPIRFAFSGHDQTGKFTHLFLVQPVPGGSLVMRHMGFELSLRQYLFYLLTYFPMRLPSARNGLRNLKEQLER